MRKLLLFALMLSTLTAISQHPDRTIFLYDDDGNRIGREILFSKASGADRNSFESQEYLTEVTETLDDLEINIYPNPTKDRIVVSAKASGTSQIMSATLMNSTGMIIEKRTVSGMEKESFDLSDKAAGIYLLELSTYNAIHTWKVIKQ